MAVVTSLTLTEAETAVHLPAPPSSSSASVNSAESNVAISGLLDRPDVDQRTVVPSGGGFPSAILTCRPNSHPFQERTLYGVHEQFKIGRSVARSKPTDNNAIFDCKVLSRNHALLWYKDGKFFLQDTKSSNGTFVNNSRLSKGAEESEPREICSGDILQFGVDVQENAKKLTHGCIIATVRLFLPDGKEAKASPTIMTGTCGTGVGGAGGVGMALPAQQDLHQLNLYIQEALVREQMLENKLAMLQRLVGQTNVASDEAWKSLIDEDRLLTRVEILESQLSTYGKAMNEDRLRDETKKLMEEKEVYQDTAKQTLKKLVDEKLEAVNKQKELEKALSNIEDEYASLKELHDKDVAQNRELAVQVSRLTGELEAEIAKQKSDADESVLNTSVEATGNNSLPPTKNNLLSGATVTVSVDNEAATTTSLIQTPNTSLVAAAEDEEKADTDKPSDDVKVKLPSPGGDTNSSGDGLMLNDTHQCEEQPAANSTPGEGGEEQLLESLRSELRAYKSSLAETESFKAAANSQLADLESRLREAEAELSRKDATIDGLRDKVVQDTAGGNSSSSVATQSSVAESSSVAVQSATVTAAETVEVGQQTEGSSDNDAQQLRSQLDRLTNERLELQAHNRQLFDQVEDYKVSLDTLRQQEKPLPPPPPTPSSPAKMDTSALERSLCDAESKISELLKIKERFSEVDAERTNLAANLSELETEMADLSLQTRTATAFSIVPLAILVCAIIVAYLPSLSSLFGTAEKI